MFNDIVAAVNEVLWGKGQILIYMLLFAGVWFTYKLSFVQLRYFGHMFSLLKNSRHADKSGISSFQALCTSLSARVGTGNLAGVAIAISLGGAGAIFWMWVIAFIGMATGYAESLLGQVYKVRNTNKEFRGGPAYYIKYGLKLPWLAVAFSLCLLFGYGFIFGATQANTITDALNYAYGFSVFKSGLVITLLSALVIVGGLRAIARFSEIVVPIMSVAYVALVLGITLLNLNHVPAMLLEIITSAFGLNEAAAGTFGGAGAAPQAAASASPRPNHPASQGFVQMLGVFLDTMVLCTCTAIVILLAGGPTVGEMEGIRLTQDAMTAHVGNYGPHLVAIAICVFAFTSIVADYAYAECNLHLFKLDTKLGRLILTVLFLAMTFWGANADLKAVWAAADMAFGMMAVINIIAIVMLTPTIVAVSRDYIRKHELQSAMDFHEDDCAIQGQSEEGIWPKK